MNNNKLPKHLEGFFDDMVSSIGDWAEGVLPDSLKPAIDKAEADLTKAIDKVDVGSVLWQAAGAAGVPLPLEVEIQSLYDKSRALNQKYYTTESYRNSQLPAIGRLDMPQAAAKAAAMDTVLSQAQSQCVAAQKLLADAAALGVSSQNQIKAGNVSAVAGSANFFSKKQGADANYDSAMTRINGALAQFETLQRDAIAWQQLKVTDVTAAVKKTAEELAAKTKAAAEMASKFAPFALPLAIALLAGYAIMSVGPRRR